MAPGRRLRCVRRRNRPGRHRPRPRARRFPPSVLRTTSPPRPARGPGERVRVGEILSYLTAALPADASADSRLLALQCALRVNTRMRVVLPRGMLRSLGIDAAEACSELGQTRWLNRVDGPGTGGIAAQLRDSALLAQPPARPDRRQAADWALRRGSPVRMGVAEPRQRLLGVYLMAHSDP